jgi:glutamate-5-semialdehyde dehydrogenase
MLNATDRVIIGGVPVEIGAELAARFRPGDLLFGVGGTRILHVPEEVNDRVRAAVDRAAEAFDALQVCDQSRVTRFYELFAEALSEDGIVDALKTANVADVERARAKGRSTTRLVVTDSMLGSMRDALSLWRDAAVRPNTAVETVDHGDWSVDVVRAPLGVVAFVFEGRPNVFSDATGVLRTGNTCVFRIGSDALGTARVMMDRAVRPSLIGAGLPVDAVVLVDDESHASAWSLFAQRTVALAVARGSGNAVSDLGAVARQSGIPVSLHGTGGAWLIASDDSEPDRLRRTVRHSLDRKVCNTLNVVCLVGSDWRSRLGPVVDGVEEAARVRGSSAVIHDVTGACVGGDPSTEIIAATVGDLAREWEWEDRPEVSIVAASTLDDALALFNEHSPKFVLSVVSPRAEDFEHAWSRARAPFVGDGMTRWVDGQFALRRPELGLANWEHGPILGHGAILSGDDVFTIRYRVAQRNPDMHR